jgi:glycosyltransferase involved in cell wall biosynthesis
MTLRVAVLDMQPITPPVGGGRLRLLGLYHALGAEIETRYVGTYDWPGEPFRKLQLTAGLEETIVPLSAEHHRAARELSATVNGKNVIDLAFHQQAHLSPEYLAASREVVRWGEIVVFSHPWVFPLVDVPPNKPVVYDSHNVEGLLRAQILTMTHAGENRVLREVIRVEHELCRRAEVVLACSHEDALLFAKLYDVPLARIRVVPNGVLTEHTRPPKPQQKMEARRALGLSESARVAIFIGSDYPPNVEAARFITEGLAARMSDLTFVLAGGVGTRISTGPDNVTVTGVLGEDLKTVWLSASDVALNPMLSGSGTNIKMFDYMAAGLPTITTPVGARGIVCGSREPMIVVEPRVEHFSEALNSLLSNRIRQQRIGEDARRCVEEDYSWEDISARTGRLFSILARKSGRPSPGISVVVPTYERHAQLTRLIELLSAQSFRNFEVVVVDQSDQPWVYRWQNLGIEITYWHTKIRGAARARNTGAYFAQGAIIGFIDDDCEPASDWLERAWHHLTTECIVGIEGIIESDHLGDPAFRPVTNVGFEGIGFMTANLFVRTSEFFRLGGFDLRFDRPHFREDTDFGWRLQELGAVPFCADVRVMHPAQPRSVERESLPSRGRFFEKDALLYAKHPSRYAELFRREGHWRNSREFWENFWRGGRKYGVDLTSFDEYFRRSIFEARS